MIENNSICPAVWDNLCINTAGKSRLCCNSITRAEDSFLENFDGHWLTFRDKIKKEMLDNIRPKECNSCWQKEDSDIHSLRNYLIDNYKAKNLWENFLHNVHKNNDYPLDLDLKLGNYCNLSCRMCNSYSSSKYQSEFKKIYKETGIDYGVNNYEKHFIQKDWYHSSQFLNFLQKSIDNGLRSIKFTGGEPLMVPNVLTIINYCIDTDRAKFIDLSIITNVTLINEFWLEKFSHFKEISLICSIDGIENTYNYIRHPANWKDVYHKLNLIKEKICSKFIFSITFTLQIYNILEIDNIIKLKRELNTILTCIALYEPNYLDVRNSPESLKKYSLENIMKIIPLDKNEKKFITDVVNKINQSPNDREVAIEEFKKITLLKDKYKMQNFNELEIAKYYG